MKKRRGQILIIVLLIVVVALAVGLSVASRNITNLRISTQTEQSQRAFTAAEGGVEDILSRLTTVAPATGSQTFPVTVGDITANVTVKSSQIYESTIQPGEIGQIDLLNMTSPFTLQIDWSKSSDPLEKANIASVELTLVNNSGGGNYGQSRIFWQGILGRADELVPIGNPTPSCSSPSTNFDKCGEWIITTPDPVLLRIKPLWNKATVKVSCISAGCELPVQTYDINSEATSEIGVTRRVQVRKTALPQLPAVFDYVLYSEGDIVK